MAARRELPGAARCVIVGGGVGGTSIAYHLAELGWDDVVLVDRNQLTSGSTFHSAGLVGQLRSSVNLTKMMMYSVELYRKLGDACGWVECGGIRLASSEERMEELRRQAGWAKTFGLPLDLISAEEAQGLFPLMSTDGVLGAAWLPTDGYLDPSQLTFALAEGAREGGVQIFTGTRVTGIEQGRVRTERGDIDAEVVVIAGGMFSAELGRLAGVRIPIVPMSHEYIVTQPFRERDPQNPLPTLRDPDLLIYFREEGGGLVMGGYERPAAPAFTPHGGADFDRIPPDFNGRLLEDDWDRFEEIVVNSRRRVPQMEDVKVTRMINGPGGIHSRQRVLPRRDGGARRVRGGRLLRTRPRGRGRRGQGDGGVDRGGRALDGPLADGRAPLRRAVPLPLVHARARARDLRDLLRHPLPLRGAPGGPARCAPPRHTSGTASAMPPSARSRAGSA